MNDENYKELLDEALADRDVRVAREENRIRRKTGAAFEAARKEKKITVRSLAQKMDTSPSQVQRVLHKEVGGSLTVSTLCRAADALDMTVTVNVRPRRQDGKLFPFGTSTYSPAKDLEPVEEGRRVPVMKFKLAAGCESSCWDTGSQEDK